MIFQYIVYCIVEYIAKLIFNNMNMLNVVKMRYVKNDKNDYDRKNIKKIKIFSNIAKNCFGFSKFFNNKYNSYSLIIFLSGAYIASSCYVSLKKI
jgi:hypothetical protein